MLMRRKKKCMHIFVSCRFNLKTRKMAQKLLSDAELKHSELTNMSPRFDMNQVKCHGLKPWDHQLAAAHQGICIENGTVTAHLVSNGVSRIPDSKKPVMEMEKDENEEDEDEDEDENDDEDENENDKKLKKEENENADASVPMYVRTRIGIYGDRVGSGKTLTMLIIVMRVGDTIDFPTSTNMMLRGLASVTLPDVQNIDTTLIVVGHQLMHQWVECATNVMGLQNGIDFKSFCSMGGRKSDGINEVTGKKRTFFQLNDGNITDVTSGQYRIVFLTPDAYKQLCESGAEQSYCVKRLIIDEADTLVIANFQLFPAGFTWLMTGTPDCFFTTSRRGTNKSKMGMLNDIFKVTSTDPNNKSQSAFIRAHTLALKTSLVHCNASFVQESLNIPDWIKKTIPTAPIIHEIMKIRCIRNDTDIMSKIMSGMMNEHTFIAAARKVVCSRGIYYPKVNLNDTIFKTCCALTLEPLKSDKIVFDCCKMSVNVDAFGSYCSKINTLNLTKCMFCDSTTVKPATAPTVYNTINFNTIYDKYSICFTVSEIIIEAAKDITSKFLVFANDDNLEKIKEMLKDEKGITIARLKGSGVIITRLINDFENGRLRMLILSAKNNVAGLNLQATSHIICMHPMPSTKFKQIVGRGQRFGRTKPLTVHHMQDDDGN